MLYMIKKCIAIQKFNKTNISKSGLWQKNKSWLHVMYVALELVLLDAKQRIMGQENSTVPSAEP